MENTYYSYEPIMKLKDLDGKEPSIYLISSNRSAGKTTGFLINSLKWNHNELPHEWCKAERMETVFLYRTASEIKSSGVIYTDVLQMYPDYGVEITTKSIVDNLITQIMIDDYVIGYGVSLHNPDKLKKYSPLFANVGVVLFDEYQLETGRYITNEVDKLQSALQTISRGGGAQSRNIKVFMLSNFVSILNPYFIQFGIHKRLKADTHFMRGHGWVAEFGFNESASKAIKENAITIAFNNDTYMKYSTEKVYLNDDIIFIKKPTGRSKYMFTIQYDNKLYAVRDYFDEGYVYVSEKPDMSFKTILCFKSGDHKQNTVMLERSSFIWKFLRESFTEGLMRFETGECKNMIFDIIAVDLWRK